MHDDVLKSEYNEAINRIAHLEDDLAAALAEASRLRAEKWGRLADTLERCGLLEQERDALAARVTALEANDRRYRWLRDYHVRGSDVRLSAPGFSREYVNNPGWAQWVDATVDAALSRDERSENMWDTIGAPHIAREEKS